MLSVVVVGLSAWCFCTAPTVQFFMQAFKASGYAIDGNMVSCEPCEGAISGGMKIKEDGSVGVCVGSRVCNGEVLETQWVGVFPSSPPFSLCVGTR